MDTIVHILGQLATLGMQHAHLVVAVSVLSSLLHSHPSTLVQPLLCPTVKVPSPPVAFLILVPWLHCVQHLLLRGEEILLVIRGSIEGMPRNGQNHLLVLHLLSLL